MTLDGSTWNTVTNYILSNMMITPLYRSTLQIASTSGNKKKTNIEDKIKQTIANLETKRELTEKDRSRIRQEVLAEISYDKMGIYELYNYYLGLEHFHTVRTAVEKAYNSIVLNNPELTRLLSESGNRPIIYMSNNEILGYNGQSGQNIIGTILMQIRNNIMQAQIREKQGEIQKNQNATILKLYVIFSGLQKAIYRGENPEKIDLVSLREDLTPEFQNIIIQSYNRGQLPLLKKEISNPGTMLEFFKKEYIRLNREIINNSIVGDYIRGVIRKKYPTMPEKQVDQAVIQFASLAPSPEMYAIVKNEIINLVQVEEKQEKSSSSSSSFSRSSKSSSSSNEIVKFFKDPVKELLKKKNQRKTIVDEKGNEARLEDIEVGDTHYQLLTREEKQAILKKRKEALNYTENITQVESKQWVESKVPEANEPIFIYASPNPTVKDGEYQVFAPLFKREFIVDNLSYPSVSIYITVMLVTQTGVYRDYKRNNIFLRGTPVAEARKLLMQDRDFRGPDEAVKIYEKRKVESFVELEKTFANIALKKKFEDPDLAKLLLLTGNKTILWNDMSDKVLGVGENYVGKTLMKLRKEVKMGPEKFHESLDKFILQDRFMKSWMEMRVGDMCNTVYKFQVYLDVIGDQPQDIEPKFIKYILKSVYNPCVPLVNYEGTRTIVPQMFRDIVTEKSQGITKDLKRDYQKELRDIQEKIENTREQTQGADTQALLKIFNGQKESINKAMKEEEEILNNSHTDIAQIYWDVIAPIIKFVDDNKGKRNQSIRQIIVNSELLNSVKSDCENKPVNLDEQQDNCIASAIGNILIVIQGFKMQYAENIPFGEYDIDLAVSIITNKNFNRKKPALKPVSLDQPELKYRQLSQIPEEEEEKEEENDGYEEVVQERDEQELVDEDPERGGDEYEEVEDLEFTASFGMGPDGLEPQNDFEAVRMIIRQIIGAEPVDELVKYFISAIDVVKNAKMPADTKQNRINFFADLRK
jgi:predicted NAD-dependent protein-ADP-ribosyltransferase YbiA (DUF1768 family)